MTAAKFVRYLPVAIFLALAVMPVALFTVTGPWPGRSVPEFAPLQPLPSGRVPGWRLSTMFWFSDRIGLRWPLLWLGGHISDKIWQARVRGSVIIGREPWLFWSDDESLATARMADVRGRLRLTPDDVAAIEDNLRAVKAAYSACGRRAFMMVAPNKQSIYPELMREDWVDYRLSRFDDLIEKLSPDVRTMIIDPRPAMRAMKYAHPTPLYHLTDTHWNSLGTYHAYRAVLERLAEAGSLHAPERAALDNYNLTIRKTDGGDIPKRIMRVSDRFSDIAPILEPKPPLRDATASSTPEGVAFVNPDGHGRLVINGDSFAASLGEFLARHFGEVTVFTRFSTPLAFDGKVADRLRADVAIVEIVERFLPILKTPPRNLGQACASQ